MKISVIRPDHLGDHVLFSGAWKHLRSRWPDATISLHAPGFAINLYEHCPYIDHIVPIGQIETDALGQGLIRTPFHFPGKNRLSRLIANIRRPFVRDRYSTDLVILPVRTPPAAYHEMVRFIPSPWKIGIDDDRSNPTAETLLTEGSYTSRLNTKELPKDFPELELNRRFLNFLGCEVTASDLWPEFWTTLADQSYAESLLPDNDGIVLALAPGVPSRVEKQLPPEWYAKAFQNSVPFKGKLVLFGTKAESEYVKAVIAELSPLGKFPSIENLVGKTTPRQLVECIKRCDLVLSQETGFLHIAIALHKLAIGIVGGGYFNRFFPWGPPESVYPIVNKMECFGCEWICKYDVLRCLQEIAPGQASLAINAALSKVPKKLLS